MEPIPGTSFSCFRSFNQSDFNRFAVLSGDDNPIHVDPEFSRRTKFGRTVAHGMLLYATISGCLSNWLMDTCQVAQELVFPSPTFAGEPLDIHMTIAEVNNRRGSIAVETRITRQDGEITCQSTTQLALLPKASMNNFPNPAVQPSEAEVWKGLSLGQSAQTQRTFNKRDLDEYCALVQEGNPLFRDREYANEHGFRDTPVPEALLGGMISYLLGTRVPGRGTNWLKQRLTFLEPVYPQEEIIASVEIVRLRPEKDLVNLRTLLGNSLGTPLCTGEALVLVKDLDI